MVFQLELERTKGQEMPLNYAYPLSSAIYRIISKGDFSYAQFLHDQGYGKGFKLFTFSQLRVPFELAEDRKDRMVLTGSKASCQVAFHMPDAMENFVKGLFKSETIELADRISKVQFRVAQIVCLPNPLKEYAPRETVSVRVRPLSPIVAGEKKENGNYEYLPAADERFVENLRYNWWSKIEACYGEKEAKGDDIGR